MNNKELLSPKLDVVFKMLFGDRKNKGILSNFLASILEIPFDEFEEITIVNPELEKQLVSERNPTKRSFAFTK